MSYLPLLPLTYEASGVFPKRTIAVRPDVTLMVSSGTLPEKTQRSTGTTAPVFELSYNRRNAILGEVDRKPVELQPGHALLGFLGEAAGRSEYDFGEDILLYSIWVSPRAFDGFCADVCGRSEWGFHSFRRGAYAAHAFQSDPQEERVVRKLDRCISRERGPLNKLLLESCVLELLSINLEKMLCGIQSESDAGRLTRTDRERLAYAREILLERLEAPPTLLELSRMIQMNDCKLKRSFKQCYGETVYEFVRDQRFEKAFLLLEQGERNVSEAAFAVGYTNVSHFSESFQKRFGISPCVLCRGGSPLPYDR